MAASCKFWCTGILRPDLTTAVCRGSNIYPFDARLRSTGLSDLPPRTLRRQAKALSDKKLLCLCPQSSIIFALREAMKRPASTAKLDPTPVLLRPGAGGPRVLEGTKREAMCRWAVLDFLGPSSCSLWVEVPPAVHKDAVRGP